MTRAILLVCVVMALCLTLVLASCAPSFKDALREACHDPITRQGDRLCETFVHEEENT